MSSLLGCAGKSKTKIWIGSGARRMDPQVTDTSAPPRRLHNGSGSKQVLSVGCASHGKPAGLSQVIAQHFMQPAPGSRRKTKPDLEERFLVVLSLYSSVSVSAYEYVLYIFWLQTKCLRWQYLVLWGHDRDQSSDLTPVESVTVRGIYN